MTRLLLLPAMTLVVLIFGGPLLRYGWLSFHSNSVITGLVDIPNQGANWQRLISDGRFWQDASQTIRFAGISVGIELVFAIAIALLLNQSWRSRGAIRTLTLLPWALPTTVMALGWRWIFNTPYGPLESLGQIFGLSPLNFLADPHIAWIATVVGDVWKTTPFLAVIFLAGLQMIPESLYEAFQLEGGSTTASLRYVTLPLLRPYILLATFFRLAQAFGVFDLIQVMTRGGPAGSTESLALYAYLNAMRFLDFGYAATIMMGMFIMLVSICLISWLLLVVCQTSVSRGSQW